MELADPIHLPVGFERFHRARFVDYQLNRARSLGLADEEDLRRGAAAVRRIRDVPGVFTAIAEDAARAERWAAAAGALRVAEFFTPGRDSAKLVRYQRFRELFERALPSVSATRSDVPFGDAFLPAYRLPAIGGPPKGTVVIHGGFDSLIEEFVGIWQRIAHAGYDVIAFDGPGQGGARRLAGLPFDHDWERPVAAIVDHFAIQGATLVGLSMGGYWALRAAAHEPRIERVVSWPPVYDWLLRVPRPVRPVATVMLRQRGFMRWSVRVRSKLVPTLGAVVDQALYNVDATDPVAVVDWFLGMNPDHLGSERITQDVLVLIGEHDRFQPPMLARAQIAALVGARRVTSRTFTKAEHADQHCQMGNLPLACQVLTDWLDRPS